MHKLIPLPNGDKKVLDKPQEFKVTPEILQIIYMDEIAGRLAEISERISDSIPKGRTESYSKVVTSEGAKVVPKTGRAWCQVTIVNDGNGDVYFSSNVFSSSGAPLRKGETFSYDARSHVIEMIYLRTKEGEEAKVRIWGML